MLSGTEVSCKCTISYRHPIGMMCRLVLIGMGSAVTCDFFLRMLIHCKKLKTLTTFSSYLNFCSVAVLFISFPSNFHFDIQHYECLVLNICTWVNNNVQKKMCHAIKLLTIMDDNTDCSYLLFLNTFL